MTTNTTIQGRQKKKALESYSQKQKKASTSGPAIVSQNKVNLFLIALSVKTSSSKPFLFPIPKKQSNSPQVDLSSKLVNNSKCCSNYSQVEWQYKLAKLIVLAIL